MLSAKIIISYFLWVIPNYLLVCHGYMFKVNIIKMGMFWRKLVDNYTGTLAQVSAYIMVFTTSSLG